MSETTWTEQMPDHETMNSTMTNNGTVPTITILGVFKGGKLARLEWLPGEDGIVSLSDRTVEALAKLKVAIEDDPSQYQIKGELI